MSADDGRWDLRVQRGQSTLATRYLRNEDPVLSPEIWAREQMDLRQGRESEDGGKSWRNNIYSDGPRSHTDGNRVTL